MQTDTPGPGGGAGWAGTCNYFNCKLDNLTKDQLLDYFYDLLQSHPWNTVKLDLYGLQFFYKKCSPKNMGTYPTHQTAEDYQNP